MLIHNNLNIQLTLNYNQLLTNFNWPNYKITTLLTSLTLPLNNYASLYNYPN